VNQLLSEFKSIDQLKKANLGELESVIGKKRARLVYEQINSPNNK
jgi:ERCC4-type nuclease